MRMLPGVTVHESTGIPVLFLFKEGQLFPVFIVYKIIFSNIAVSCVNDKHMGGLKYVIFIYICSTSYTVFFTKWQEIFSSKL